MAFTAKDVQALREQTGCGMMDCKKALTQADGDMEKAIEILREKGLAAVAKKAGRIASEGVVACYGDETATAMVEVNSETDFVAKNADFQAFCANVAKTVVEANPADMAALMAAKCVGTEFTVEEVLREKVLTIGENLNIRRFFRTANPAVTYIHGGGKIGVVVELETEAKVEDALETMGKDVCMQIAAMNPQYLSKETVDAAVIESEKNILIAQIKNDPKNANKPDNIVEKMVMGRIGKFYENNCLLQQAFVKNGDMTVEQYVESVAKEIGAQVKVSAFTRFEKGEGLAKREDDFAAEVASMTK